MTNRLATARLPAPRSRAGLDRGELLPVPLPRFAFAHCALVGAALVLWVVSLRGADLDAIAGLGLLNALPATYYVAFALILAGFSAAVTRDPVSPKVLALYVVALVLVLHATTPLLYEEPRYAWVYKHLGVVELIAATGGVDRVIDVYHNWPGFFALNAWLSSLTGLPPKAYAEWAQVFFGLVNVGVLHFALRGVTRDDRLLWTACCLFVLANWIGQDYFAPQALGFSLSLLVLGLCLRCRPAPRMAHSRMGRWWDGRMERVDSLMPPGWGRSFVPTRPLAPRGALALGGVCYLAIVVTHQLSPVILIVAVAVISLVARRVPLWVPAAMAAIEVWWLVLAWPFFREHFTLLDPNPSATPRPPDTHLADALPGFGIVLYASAAVVALMALLAAVGFIRRRRVGHSDVPAACLVLAPALVVGLQSYGGESALRGYLFALPWLAFFAAAACSPAPHRRLALLRPWRLALAASLVSVCLLPAYFGRELVNHVPRDDVQAAVWYEKNAPTGSAVMLVAGDFPSRLTMRYPQAWTNSLTSLANRSPVFRGHRLGAGDVARIEALMLRLGERRVFLILSRLQERYARLYGVLPSGSIESLGRALRASPAFHLVYQREGARIFEYVIQPEVRRQR